MENKENLAPLSDKEIAEFTESINEQLKDTLFNLKKRYIMYAIRLMRAHLDLTISNEKYCNVINAAAEIAICELNMCGKEQLVLFSIADCVRYAYTLIDNCINECDNDCMKYMSFEYPFSRDCNDEVVEKLCSYIEDILMLLAVPTERYATVSNINTRLNSYRSALHRISGAGELMVELIDRNGKISTDNKTANCMCFNIRHADKTTRLYNLTHVNTVLGIIDIGKQPYVDQFLAGILNYHPAQSSEDNKENDYMFYNYLGWFKQFMSRQAHEVKTLVLAKAGGLTELNQTDWNEIYLFFYKWFIRDEKNKEYHDKLIAIGRAAKDKEFFDRRKELIEGKE